MLGDEESFTTVILIIIMSHQVAGDEESFTTFKDLFDIVIEKRTGGYKSDALHATDLDISKVSKTKIDPDDKYVLTTRCRTGRSVRGLLQVPPHARAYFREAT